MNRWAIVVDIRIKENSFVSIEIIAIFDVLQISCKRLWKKIKLFFNVIKPSESLNKYSYVDVCLF